MYYLDFTPMNERDMIDYLGEVEDLEKTIPEMLEKANRKYEFREECIYRNSFHPMKMDGTRSPNRNGDPVFRTLVAVNKDMDRQKQDADREIQQIKSWGQKLEYVRSCLLKIPHEERQILTELYIKKKAVKEYAMEQSLSESTLRRKSRKSMADLLANYNAIFKSKYEDEIN